MDTGAEWSISRRYGREIRFGNEYLFKDGAGTYQYQFAAIGEIASILGMNTVDLLENGGHLVCLVSENNSSNYYGVSAELSAELECYKLMLQHKDELIEKQRELLEQQKRELAALNEIIALMKGRSS